VNRGGILRCRPGFNWRANLLTGKLQGFAEFAPSSLSGVQLVAAVAGKIYVAVEPYDTFTEIPGLQFSEEQDIQFTTAEKAVSRNPDGSLVLVTPYSVLMIQDGVTAPGYWDGATGAHIAGGINATKTPVGTFMKWSGGRLWVAYKNRLWAGDYADPFSFFEAQYLGQIGSFILPGRITGMGELPDANNPSLLVFTDNTTTRFLSNIRTRTLWPDVENFQQVIMPETGCVSHRSIVSQGGLLWWFSAYGWTNLNFAAQLNVDGKRFVVDSPMAVSKAWLFEDLSGVASASFENYVLASVPFAALDNRHTWVLDTEGQPNWNSIWTGIRPVQWVSAVFNGRARLFCASTDADGGNRVWEAFGSDRTDNGCPITWGMLTRGFGNGTTLPQEPRFLDVFMTDLNGTVDVAVSWAGVTKGRFHRVMTKRVKVMPGSINATRNVTFDNNEFALRAQNRKLRTAERFNTELVENGGCGVESDREDWIDIGFQFCITVNGEGGIRGLRALIKNVPEDKQGKCEEDETGFLGSRYDGISAYGETEEEVLEAIRDVSSGPYSATKTASATYGAVTTTATKSAESMISQQTADKMAQEAAEFVASVLLAQQSPEFYGSFIDP
jgi:hypothetical protein